jgi:hypothetical protein
MFTGGAFLIVGTMYGSYGIPYSVNSSAYNQISAISADTGVMQNSLTNSGAPSSVGFLEYIVTGGWSSLLLLFHSGTFVSNIVYSISADYGVPSIFSFGLITIVSITILFAIISIIFRKKS